MYYECLIRPRVMSSSDAYFIKTAGNHLSPRAFTYSLLCGRPVRTKISPPSLTLASAEFAVEKWLNVSPTRRGGHRVSNPRIMLQQSSVTIQRLLSRGTGPFVNWISDQCQNWVRNESWSRWRLFKFEQTLGQLIHHNHSNWKVVCVIPWYANININLGMFGIKFHFAIF